MNSMNLRNRHSRLSTLAGNNYGRYSPRRSFKWAGLALLLIFVLAVAIPACTGYYEVETTTTVVNSHERVCDSNSDGGQTCKYLVFTEAGTFELTDSLYLGRWNSSDMYGRIKDGQTYRIEHYGWRFGCTSSYPNIKSMEEV